MTNERYIDDPAVAGRVIVYTVIHCPLCGGYHRIEDGEEAVGPWLRAMDASIERGSQQQYATTIESCFAHFNS